IQEINERGVTAFETRVSDSHTQYLGKDGYQVKSRPQYKARAIADRPDLEQFRPYSDLHQQGATDYFTFCQQCAETGIEKWSVCLNKMTCTYYDKAGNEIWIEQIPQ